MLKVTDLTMDYLAAPIGVEKLPVFGWKAVSDKRNIMQTAYRLQIGRDSAFCSLIYDSGMVLSGESAHIKLTGITLESTARYYVRVKIVDNTGEESSFSEPETFVTALLDSEWFGKYITVPFEEESKSEAYYIRKEFTLQGEVREAYLCSTALGIYHAYINGEKAGADELAPGWTAYHKNLLYQINDITSSLNAGDNTIGIMLGAGWYKGSFGPFGTRNHYGDRLAFLGEIHILYANGKKEIIGTDESFQAKRSPVIFSEIYDGEIYDAGRETPNWHCNYLEDEEFVNCIALEHSYDILTAQPGCRLKVMEEVKAKEIFQTPEGDLVVDFGQNLAGFIRVKAKGSYGDRIELNCFEILDKDGNVYTENLRTARQTLLYIFGEKEESVYQPFFTYQGFRYARIKEYPGTPKVDNFTACAVYSEMERTGYFECSDSRINQLQSNILWGMKGNFVDIPTDCPQRDERLGWTGDAQIFCRTACYLMNTYQFYSKWLKDLALEQHEAGGVPHVVPDLLSMTADAAGSSVEDTHSAAAWADAAVIVPWTLYLVYGDKDILVRQYKSMKTWIDFMETHAEDYIWNYRQQFGDWLALDAKEGSYYGATPNTLTCTAFFAYSTELFAKIAGIIGNIQDKKRYSELHKKIVTKYRKTFVDADGKLLVRTQTAHILSLMFGLIPDEYKTSVAKDLADLLEKENNHLVTGFVGTPYFCQVLSGNGYSEKAYSLLLQTDYPSWLYQVEKGATTVWEHWDGLKENGEMWSADMNSFNHYAYGAVGSWLYQSAAGIETDERDAGYRRIIFRPHVSNRLSYVTGEYESIYGRVCSMWTAERERVCCEFEIPVNTTAVICLEGNIEILEKDGLMFEWESGKQEYRAEAGSGRYRVIYRRTVILQE